MMKTDGMTAKKTSEVRELQILWDRVQASKPKTTGNEPEEIVNKDLGYVSQNLVTKMMGNNPKPCRFVYMIAPQNFPFFGKDLCLKLFGTVSPLIRMQNLASK